MYEERLEQELRDCFQAETKTIEPTPDWWDRNISLVTGQGHISLCAGRPILRVFCEGWETTNSMARKRRPPGRPVPPPQVAQSATMLSPGKIGLVRGSTPW